MNFQTPPIICDLMVSRINGYPKTILEPTSGNGNIVNAITKRFSRSEIITPLCFENLKIREVDQVIANPPFSPMVRGYKMVERFFKFSDNLIVLLPYNALIDSDSRTEFYIEKGLKEVLHLPRRTFRGSRVQSCILVFDGGYHENININFSGLKLIR